MGLAVRGGIVVGLDCVWRNRSGYSAVCGGNVGFVSAHKSQIIFDILMFFYTDVVFKNVFFGQPRRGLDVCGSGRVCGKRR